MKAAITATTEIVAAIRTVPNVRVWEGLRQEVAPPAVIVGPPDLEWTGGTYCAEGPARGQWPVFVVASLTEFATGQLLELVEPVAEAIGRYTEAVVERATKGLYPAGGTKEYPAYQIVVWRDL